MRLFTLLIVCFLCALAATQLAQHFGWCPQANISAGGSLLAALGLAFLGVVLPASQVVFGTVPAFAPAPEATLLVNSVDIDASRDAKWWKTLPTGAETLGRYRNPKLKFTINAYISTQSGFGSQHPGTAVTTLANFTSTVSGQYRGFEATDGVMVFEDVKDKMTIEDLVESTITIIHMPFVA